MGRKTACSLEEWREITRGIAKELSKKLRVKMKRIDINEWRKIYGQALRQAAELAIDDCNVDRIIQEVVSKY